MFSFSFNSFAAICGISGIIGFYFYVSAARGESYINTRPESNLDKWYEILVFMNKIVRYRNYVVRFLYLPYCGSNNILTVPTGPFLCVVKINSAIPLSSVSGS